VTGYLLDTSAYLAWVTDDGRIGPRATDELRSARVAASDVSLWEVAVKVRIGKLRVDGEVGAWFEHHAKANRFQPVPVARPHLARVAVLPLHHRDPFDRLLIAQAQIEGLTLVSTDRAVREYDVSVLDAAA
jgi:PIN domain nuclease of toxin-antitoxin system